MRRTPPFRIALEAFQAHLARGDWPMGMPLQIAPLADELKFSSTPIREALAFLAGQGVIEERRGSGYFTARLDVRRLAQAYDLHGLLIEAALRAPRRGSLPDNTAASEPLDPAVGLEPGPIFDAITRLSGQAALSRAQRAIGLLLGRARRAEAAVFADWLDELADVARLSLGEDAEAAAQAVRRYHARRQDHASEIMNLVEDEDARASWI